MRGLIGCAGVIAAIAFFLGLLGSLFAAEVSLALRLGLAAMVAAIAFVAVVLLGTRDSLRYAATKRRVHNMLLARPDVKDTEFAAQFPDCSADLVLQTREAISQFFGVPAGKIHPSHRLRDDLRRDVFEPGFHSFVVYRVLNLRHVTPQPFVFHTTKSMDIGDFLTEIQRVLDGFGQGNSGRG